ncbi:DedA family protein, partial [Pelagibacterales bacterium SAG-MED15]|nr:DedA family protein [Pelagibacterales bacterium SAG-MED15]
LYLKSLELASHKKSELYLAIVSFIESSFFPIPPDVMIVPMVMAKKEKFIRIFLNATIFSVLGGILGYFIGFIFSDLAMSVVDFYNYQGKVNDLRSKLTEGSGIYIWLFTLFLAGFTPLPFKVFTITSGLIGFNIFIFILICLISRGLRFYLVSFLTFKFGGPFVEFIEKKGTLWSTVVGLLLIPFFLLIYFIIK